MGLPSRHVTFVISFDDPLELAVLPDGTRRPTRFDAVVSGFHTRPAVIRHDGTQHGVQLQVTAAGARALFGMPAGELVAAAVPLDVLWGRLADELLARLDAATAWSERFAVLEQVLVPALSVRVDIPSGARPETTEAFRRLTALDGRLDVATLRRRSAGAGVTSPGSSPPSTASGPRRWPGCCASNAPRTSSSAPNATRWPPSPPSADTPIRRTWHETACLRRRQSHAPARRRTAPIRPRRRPPLILHHRCHDQSDRVALHQLPRRRARSPSSARPLASSSPRRARGARRRGRPRPADVAGRRRRHARLSRP